MNKKPYTHYQTRITKFVWTGNIYGVVCPLALWFYNVSAIGWLIYVSTMVIQYSLASMADAIFDSLSERTNIQSSWLDVRLSALENALHSESGQDKWREIGIPTNDPAHYYSNYPEKLDGQ